jgi:hypothetical protein
VAWVEGVAANQDTQVPHRNLMSLYISTPRVWTDEKDTKILAIVKKII